MAKRKPVSKYADMLSYSDNKDKTYKDLFFVDSESKSIISTDGYRMLARRDIYNEISVIAKLAGTEVKTLRYLNNVFEPDTFTCPDFVRIIPSETSLKENYKKIRMAIPTWLLSLYKKTKGAYLSIVLGETPILAIGTSYENGVPIDSKFLKHFAGSEVDIYVPTHTPISMPFMVLPSGQEYKDANWFSLIMPVMKMGNCNATYVG
jgi:hypothetical protein